MYIFLKSTKYKNVSHNKMAFLMFKFFSNGDYYGKTKF